MDPFALIHENSSNSSLNMFSNFQKILILFIPIHLACILFILQKSGNSLTFGTVSGGLGGPGVSQASFQQKQSSQFSQMTSSSGGGGGMSAANNMSSSMMSSSQQKSFQQTSMSSASSFERSSFSSSSQQKKTNRVSGGFQV